MSILIKGMAMPTDCIFCPMFHGAWTMCTVLNKTTRVRGRPDDCPLVPVPPHGRLIDADALVRDNGIKEIPEYHEVVLAAPTIIPASEEHTMEEFMYGQEGNPNDGSM